VFRRIWKAIEAKAGKFRIVEAKERGEERRKRKEKGKATKEDGSMKDSRRVRDLG